MKARVRLVAGLTLFALLLAGCAGTNRGSSSGGDTNPPVTSDTFTVVWKNYDGSVLETDTNVEKGSMPSYDGAIPTRESTQQYSYAFEKWTPSLSVVVSDITYTATYIENVNSYQVSVVINNESLGSVSGSGSYNFGSSVTLTASPISDNVFEGWYSDSGLTTLLSTSNPYTFNLESEGVTVYAKFFTKVEEEAWNISHGVTPTLSEDGKTITYGLYPQTNVNDSSLVSALNALMAPESNGWYFYNDEYYAKVSATPWGTVYKFDNGAAIVSGTTYWFKCEPITWNVLSNTNSEYYILSSVLLDPHCYHNSTSNRTIDGKTIYTNNYEYSDIRTWLNNDFCNSAFALGKSHIQTTTVDNSASTTNSTNNTYACNDTQDKVFLPSYKDYINSSYGFSTSTGSTNTRYCKTTDWARARGAFYNANSYYLYNGFYWTRSPISYSGSAWGVSHDGLLGSNYVYHTGISVRPGLSIKIA